jgi:lipoyl(octanoyl) transferase
MPYRDAWAVQERVHAEVLAGGEERLLLVEHPPVITFGRRAETQGQKNLVASREYLNKLGVDLVQSDRGGDITFHGPGQIVAYPIVRLNDHRLSVGVYVRRLEQTVIDALEELAVKARRIDGCVGIWVQERAEGGEQRAEMSASDSALNPQPSALSKICAIGVRIKRGVSMHGIALNVETDLRYFDLIVPCGLAGKRATSMRKLMGDQCPPIAGVRQILATHFQHGFAPERDSAAQLRQTNVPNA